MHKPPVTLWLLNRAVAWNQEALMEALSRQFDVRLGRRVIGGVRGRGRVLALVGAQVQAFEQTGAEGREGDQQEDGGQTSHGRVDCVHTAT